MREEQDLDRNGQTGVQCNDNNQQDAGWLRVDGRDDWVSANWKRLAFVARKRLVFGSNIQVPEEENGGHGEANADECIVERCDVGQHTSPVAIHADVKAYQSTATKTQVPQESR